MLINYLKKNAVKTSIYVAFVIFVLTFATSDADAKRASYNDAYNKILGQYKEACSISQKKWEGNLDYYKKKFKNLNMDILIQYHIPDHYDELFECEIPCMLGYGYYDIDGNNIPELLISVYEREIVCIDIYTFDGKKAIKLFDIGKWYTSYSIYSNGIIARYSGDIKYYRIKKDGKSVKKVKMKTIEDEEELMQYQDINFGWKVFAKDIKPKKEKAKRVLTDKQIKAISKGLKVPDNLNIRVKQGKAHYWKTGQRWVITVNFTYKEELVACADVDADTGELVKEIWVFSEDHIK